ncbi:MAG TPA: hypothetical protein VFZ63_08600 [Jiangellaceae bacterium]
MTAATLAGLAVLAIGCVAMWLPRVSRRLDAMPWWLAAGIPALGLAVVALLASGADNGDNYAAVLTVVIAVLGGGPVATAVLRGAQKSGVPNVSYPVETLEPGEPETELRGGLWIGALERAAIAASLLAGQPGGIAVVVAIKGLGRYAELKAPGAAERFIIGTFASFLWAAAAMGIALLIR